MSSPLEGRRVLVTRAAGQAPVLGEMLSAEGASPIGVPVIRRQDLMDAATREALLARIGAEEFDDLVFTSANAVDCLWGGGAAAPAGPRVYAIGPGTAAALERAGWAVETLPAGFIAESLVERISQAGVSGRRILIPRARGARDVLPRLLEQMGALVEVVELYEMVPEWASQEALTELLWGRGIDCVTFTSGSTVRCFAALAGPLRPAPECVLAALGPVTAEEARRHGMAPQVVAQTHSLPGLVDALRSWYAALPENEGQP